VRNNHILEVENRRLSAEIDRLKALLNQQQKAPKMVGIGMRITDEKPHRVTEIVAGGAAYQSGEIAVGDYILEVGRMVVSQHSIETIRKNVLGQAGSYVDLVLDRRDENDVSKIFTVTIKRSEIATGSQLYQRACDMPIEVDFARKGAFLRMPLCFSVCEH
jgi:C-terminal processing protease CtpA/Prc